MGHRALQRQLIHLRHWIVHDAHGEAAVLAESMIFLIAHLFAGSQDRFAGILGFGEGLPADGHANKVLLGKRMGCDSCLILIKAADVSLIPLDFLREEFQQPVFQPVLLALVICLHHPSFP